MEWIIETIPHNQQRYNTQGDYFVDENGVNIIRVSEFADYRISVIIAVHEMIEQFLTKTRSIKEENITKFDMEHSELDDPGRSSKAPYHREHMFCDAIDILLCDQLGIDYNNYQEAMPK